MMASIGLKQGLPRLLAVACVILALVTPSVSAAGGTWLSTQGSGSWALGVVVPNGAALADGHQLVWSAASNVTALLVLPQIGSVDDTVYAILSAMTKSGSVLQVAAGIYPGMDDWRAYVLYVKEAGSEAYTWVVNESLPAMAPGAAVSLSIYWTDGAWSYEVRNVDASTQSGGHIMNDSVGGFRDGDQEVLALESYTVTDGVFATMGSMEATAILVDGAAVTGGWYALGGWDPLHNPLFVVGGLQPPAFARVSLANSSLTWIYSPEGRVEYVSSSGYGFALFVGAGAAIIATVLAVAVWERRKETDRGPLPERTAEA